MTAEKTGTGKEDKEAGQQERVIYWISPKGSFGKKEEPICLSKKDREEKHWRWLGGD